MRRLIMIVLVMVMLISCYVFYVQWLVVGFPSVSASFVHQVLATYGSPAADEAQALYDEGLVYHIDPVFALAFFLHESSFGTAGIARSTHSLGNIICTAGYPSCVRGFRSYASWELGFKDWYRLLSKEYIPKGHLTVDQIIPVYAPTMENDVQLYVCQVKIAVSAWRSGQVMVPGGRC